MAAVPKRKWYEVFNFISTLLTLLAESFFNKKKEDDTSSLPPTEEGLGK